MFNWPGLEKRAEAFEQTAETTELKMVYVKEASARVTATCLLTCSHICAEGRRRREKQRQGTGGERAAWAHRSADSQLPGTQRNSEPRFAVESIGAGEQDDTHRSVLLEAPGSWCMNRLAFGPARGEGKEKGGEEATLCTARSSRLPEFILHDARP